MEKRRRRAACSVRRVALAAWSARLAATTATAMLAAPGSAHAGDGSTSAALTVGAIVVNACSVRSRDFDAEHPAARALDVSCRHDVEATVETSEVLLLDTGARVVVGTVSF